MYTLIFKLTERKAFVTVDNEIQSIIRTDIFEQLKNLKNESVLILSLPSFKRQCFDIKKILMKKNVFLCAYEIRKKFKYLTKKQV